ncbi:MAG: ribonuclease R, partial [Oscillospiraceae bacterium]
FGFVRLDDETDIFVPGRFFIGAMPGDTVLVCEIESRTDSPEGEIIKIVKEGNSQFVGTLIKDDMGYCVSPDNLIR